MRRPLVGVRLWKVNTALVVAGAALLLVAVLGRWVTIGGNQIAKGAPLWVLFVVGAAGLLAIVWGLVLSREHPPALRTSAGFLGAPPKMPDPRRLVSRPDLSQKIAQALLAGDRRVALTGMGGTGKSTLAAEASMDRRVRRSFRDGVTWLETVLGQDPVTLLGNLCRRLGEPADESAFTTVGQGRDKLATVLAAKRMLIVVDNVWERGPLDALTGLAPDCTVLFTTRLSELADTFRATQISVDELTEEQALELLGLWTDKAPAELSNDARVVCSRVGKLALGVAMAGAMAARSRRSFTEVLALIEQDLARVHADLDPEYQYQNLRAAIEAGISDLTAAAQRRYAQLAAFAGRGPFPRHAAGAVWQMELADLEVGDLLADLTGRSLLAAAGDGWYTAHDLQYDVLKHRLGPDGLAAVHARLVESYRARYPGGWAASATDPYLAGTLTGHLHDADRGSELRALLADVDWIQARLAAAQLPGLLADYRYAGDPLSQQIAKALRMSAHTLAADPGQVRGQLAGRLLGHPDPAVAAWATALTTYDGPGPWLAPLTPALTPTTTALEQTLTGHDGWVPAVAVSADGTRAVTGGADGTVRVWDLTTGREQAQFTQGGQVPAVAVSADGTRAVTGGLDGTVRVWDLAAGREQAQLTGHDGPVSSVSASADGTRAVTGGHDGTVRVWDLTTGREQVQLTGHRLDVWSVAVSADATRAVSIGDFDAVRVWDLAAGREQARLTGHDGMVRAVAISADGTRAVTGGRDGMVRVWDLAAGREQAQFVHGGEVSAVALSADGTRAVTGNSFDGTVRVWDLATGRELAQLVGGVDVSAVAVSADGTRAVIGGHAGAVRVWDLATGREEAQLTHVGAVSAAAASADGARAVTGGHDGMVRVWDLATGREQAQLNHGGQVSAVGELGPLLTDFGVQVSAVAVSADGTVIVSGAGDGTVGVWDLTTGQAQLTVHVGPVGAMAVSADGARALIGDLNGTVWVWDLAAGREPVALTGHRGDVWSVAVTADGTRAVSGGQDAMVRVWDLATGREQAQLTGHRGDVWSVAVTADGTRAVSGSRDGMVRVWDLATGREQAQLTGHDGWVLAVAVTADGTRAVSGSRDGTVRVWDLGTGKATASWTEDSPVIACIALSGQPLKIAVGRAGGQPYLLELRGESNAT
jgi:WD40 repeat protein